MTQEEIKKQCEEIFKQIKEAEDRLKQIRELCKHQNTFEGNWSYRIGSILPAIICSDCKQLVKYK